MSKITEIKKTHKFFFLNLRSTLVCTKILKRIIKIKSYSKNCNVECISKALRYKAMSKIRGFLCVSVRSE